MGATSLAKLTLPLTGAPGCACAMEAKIEAQSRMVGRGELEGDIVRNAIPPFGISMDANF